MSHFVAPDGLEDVAEAEVDEDDEMFGGLQKSESEIANAKK